MGFWQNVDDELKYLGKTRKELAADADFDASYIPKGIARNGVPLADLALRIANVLGVSLEYLMGETENPTLKSSMKAKKAIAFQTNKNLTEIKNEIRLYRKYAQYIDGMEKLSAQKLDLVGKIIEIMGE